MLGKLFATMIAATAAAAFSAFLPVTIAPSAAQAAEIKCLCPVAMRAVMADVAPKFEQESGHKLTVDYATVGAITDRVLKGETADVAIVSVQQSEDLQKQGKILSGSKADVAKVGYGVFVRRGAPKPDIGSVEALKRSLLAANSIAYGDPTAGGPSGIYLAGLMDRLGIAADMKPKTKLLPPGGPVIEAAARGDVEIAFSVSSDIATTPGVDLVGPLPAEIQSYTRYAAGVVATSKELEAAKALIGFLASPAGQAALKAKGFEPGS